MDVCTICTIIPLLYFRPNISGDVKLTDLAIKETALDDFDLPVKLKFGCLTKLVLKIPWSDLYRQPVIANIEGFFVDLIDIYFEKCELCEYIFLL